MNYSLHTAPTDLDYLMSQPSYIQDMVQATKYDVRCRLSMLDADLHLLRLPFAVDPDRFEVCGEVVKFWLEHENGLQVCLERYIDEL